MVNGRSSISGSCDAGHADMVWISGGTFRMGSVEFYVEQRPVHEVAVNGFWIDRYPLTNEQFARFVAETGYLTVAERPLNPADFPGALLKTSFRAPWFFTGRKARLICATTRIGGGGPQGRAGVILMVHPT